MQCPFCKAAETRVVDSRLAEDGSQVRRRRACERCDGRFTTFERAELPVPLIKKRSGRAEAFDEAKLRRGIASAVYKRPVRTEAVDHAIDHLLNKLRTTNAKEVESSHLGEWVMAALRDLDHVAYVRFASIYRRFEDVNAFREEIEQLQRLPTAEQRRQQLPLIVLPDDPESVDGAVSNDRPRR